MDFFTNGILGVGDDISTETDSPSKMDGHNDVGTSSGDEGRTKEDESQEEPTFEAAMERLEAIVKEMESGRVTLDQSLDLFKEGSDLAQFCQKKLSDNENRIKQLLETTEGPREEDFHA